MRGRPVGSYKPEYIIYGGVENYRKAIRKLFKNSPEYILKKELKEFESLKKEREKQKLRSKYFYENHKDYFKNYRLKNRNKIRKYDNIFNQKPERKLYKKLNYAKHRETHIKNYYSKKANEMGLTFEEYVEMKSKCKICGFDKYPTDIHHIDKNPKNNNKENLIGLCPTCHLGIHRGYVKLESINLGNQNERK